MYEATSNLISGSVATVRCVAVAFSFHMHGNTWRSRLNSELAGTRGARVLEFCFAGMGVVRRQRGNSKQRARLPEKPFNKRLGRVVCGNILMASRYFTVLDVHSQYACTAFWIGYKGAGCCCSEAFPPP